MSDAHATGWSRKRCRLASLFLLLHLIAVFIAPFSFETVMDSGIGSPFVLRIAEWFRPYTQAVYLHHGYAFFAPDPGPSHLLHYRTYASASQSPQSGKLPDRKSQWPRLLYHRHFMLSEQLHANFVPPEPPLRELYDPELFPFLKSVWSIRRRAYEHQWRSYQRHLKAKHGAERIEMERVEHRLIFPNELRAGKRITDSELYVVLPEGRKGEGRP